MSVFTRIANRFIQRLVPPVHQRTADWLTQFEAANEVLEPHDLTDPEPPSGASVTPAAPASAGGGGHLHPDVERLLANIDRMFQKLNP
jgi:hypothetical protein